MLRVHAALPLLLVFAASVTAETPEPVLALKGLDPIELGRGKEVPGQEALECRQGLYRYRFANAENRRLFESKPKEYGIQFGGACGRMGPFSGNGHPDRFWVHDRRIYLFASEACRNSFKKDPEKHIDRPNPVPDAAAERLKRGAALLELALNGFGGADRVDGLKSYQETVKQLYRSGNQESSSTRRLTWVFPDAVHMVEEFSNPYGYAARGPAAIQIAGKQSWPINSNLRDIAWRQVLREPLPLLRQRKTKGFLAVAGAPVMLDDMQVEQLIVALHGGTTTWSIDPKTGRIVQVAYQGRRWTIGDIKVKFSDFRSVKGLILPHKRQEFFDGKPVTNPEQELQGIVLDGEVKMELFPGAKDSR